MDAIRDTIEQFIKDFLSGWILSNLDGIFVGINAKTAAVASEVAVTPATWNSTVYSLITDLSTNIMLPIGGVIITYVLVYELVGMVMAHNSMHNFDTSMFVKYIIKAGVAVMLLSNVTTIVAAIFDVDGWMVDNAAPLILSDSKTIWFRKQLQNGKPVA